MNMAIATRPRFRLPMVAKPGKAFIYGPAALQVFHQVLKEKLHGKTPTEYLERRVLRRLRLGPQRYLDDRAGNPLLAAGFVLTARQWAKMGQLVLDRGQAGRKARITRPILARLAGQSRLLVRLVEQSRRARRPGV